MHGKSINYNEGKIRPSLVLRDMQKGFIELLKVREYGNRVYDRLNWSESIGQDDAQKWLNDNLDSVFRHLLAIERGELTDSESLCLHWAHIACRALMAIEYELKD